jgi:hypothetical protein
MGAGKGGGGEREAEGNDLGGVSLRLPLHFTASRSDAIFLSRAAFERSGVRGGAPRCICISHEARIAPDRERASASPNASVTTPTASSST